MVTLKEEAQTRLGNAAINQLEKAIEQRPIALLGCLGSAIILCIGAVLISNFIGWSFFINLFDTTPRVTVEDTRTIVGSVKPLGELVTVSYKVATKDTELQLNTGYCGQSAKFAHIVEVQAGTDLTAIETSDWVFDEDSQTYTITLPPPTLTSCGINQEIRYENPSANPTCMSLDEVSYPIGRYEVINRIREDVLADGILEDAKRENEQTLVAFLSAISGKDVVIAYDDVDPVYDSSCTPEKPDDWEIVIEDNGYTYWSDSK